MHRLLLLVLPLALAASGCFDSRRRGDTPPPTPDAQVACAAPLVDCLGECVDPQSDRDHCGACGTACEVGSSCSGGACVAGCVPSCAGAACGDDGCGGSCGVCDAGMTCSDGACVAGCVPSCAGASCGDDGCGGSCGACDAGMACSSGTCTPDATPGGGERCSDATVVSSSGGTYVFTFTGHTADHTPFSCGMTSGQPDVTFRFTPAFSGTATFETNSDGVDTVMAAYASSTCAEPIDCDDDGGSASLTSRLDLAVSAGLTYYIVIAPYDASSTPAGVVSLTVTAP